MQVKELHWSNGLLNILKKMILKVRFIKEAISWCVWEVNWLVVSLLYWLVAMTLMIGCFITTLIACNNFTDWLIHSTCCWLCFTVTWDRTRGRSWRHQWSTSADWRRTRTEWSRWKPDRDSWRWTTESCSSECRCVP